jgi:hypothetical protein
MRFPSAWGRLSVEHHLSDRHPFERSPRREGTLTESPISPDNKVLVCLNHGAEDPESVLIAYLVGVESLWAGRQSVMFLTKEAVHVATPGMPKRSRGPGHRSRPSTKRT